MDGIFHGIALEFAIMEYKDVAVRVVHGDGLEVTVFALVSRLLGRALGPKRIKLPLIHGGCEGLGRGGLGVCCS